MRYVPDWRSRPALPLSFTERHWWLVPLLLVLATLVNWGCAPSAPRPRDPNVVYDEAWPGGRVVRVVDSVTGTTCLVYEGGKDGGISCDWRTK